MHTTTSRQIVDRMSTPPGTLPIHATTVAAQDPPGADGRPRASAARWVPFAVAMATLAGWFAVYAKVGSGLVLGWPGALTQISRVPRAVDFDQPIGNYVNYSPLPAFVSHAFGGTTAFGNALTQAVVMIAGTTTAAFVAARRRGPTALFAVAGFFATLIPLHVATFTGGYDNLLLALLFAATILESPRVVVIVGVLLGLTHAELGVLVGVELLALSWCGYGPDVRSRVRLLAGVVAGRLIVMAWLLPQGVGGDRLTFLRSRGVDALSNAALDVAPFAFWATMAGGWLIALTFAIVERNGRLAVMLAGCVLANWTLVAISVDESRIAALSTMPIVVVAALHGRSWSWKHVVCGCALVATFAAPFRAAFDGQLFDIGHGLQILW